jgi:hypothetical protein
MARFYPNAQSASTPQSEKRIFEALKKLGDDWVVVVRHEVACCE